MDVSCHRPFIPGTSLEPAVNPTAQASSFTLLHTAVLSVQDVRKRLYLFQKFLFLWAPDVILELELERRVFQSQLGVSSSNQCNLHHFPHTGYLEKNTQMVQSFSDTLYYV
jgi:hypothetical protein